MDDIEKAKILLEQSCSNCLLEASCRIKSNNIACSNFVNVRLAAEIAEKATEYEDSITLESIQKRRKR